jgi:hypothetical protein
MTTLLYPLLTFDLAHLVAEHLHRDEHIAREWYPVEPHHSFDECKYCQFEPAPAVLLWHWDRHDATTDGSADSCANWGCAVAVLSEAQEESTPEGITVEYPILIVPTPVEQMAAAA